MPQFTSPKPSDAVEMEIAMFVTVPETWGWDSGPQSAVPESTASETSALCWSGVLGEDMAFNVGAPPGTQALALQRHRLCPGCRRCR